MSKQNTAGAAPQENKMGVLPVGKLLAGMAVPMMISMLVQALYNIVDSVFVSRLSENAFNAVGLAFPLQSLMIAVGAGTAVGINALLSRSLGEKKQEMADRAAGAGASIFHMEKHRKGLLKVRRDGKVGLYVPICRDTGGQPCAWEAPSAGKGNKEDGLSEISQAHEPHERRHAGAAAAGAAV